MAQPRPSTEELFRSFSSRLKLFIRKRVQDEATADDILQDVFLKIHSRIETLQDETKLESWIFQITRNVIVDHYRSRFSAQESIDRNEPFEMPAEDNITEKFSEGIREMVDQLPAQYREALVLAEFEGLTQQAVADRLGLSLSGAKSRVQRARAMLKDMLMKCCHFEFDRYGTILDYHPVECCCCSQKSSASHS